VGFFQTCDVDCLIYYCLPSLEMWLDNPLLGAQKETVAVQEYVETW
jgi:hypothetical protein